MSETSELQSYDTMSVEVDETIATLTLNRPDQRNALDDVLIEQLDETIRAIEIDESIRVVIIAAAGPAFCAGHDISGPEPNMEAGGRKSESSRFQTGLEGAERRFRREQRLYVDCSYRIRDLSKPTIASVQGSCVAAGFMLVAMCDLIVASDNATFSNPVIRMGNGGVELLVEPWELGIRRAKEFLWTGDEIDAATAKRIGLVSKVVPNGELASASRDLARRIALSPPVAVSLTKRSLNHTWDLMGQRASLEHHYMVHHLAHNTSESRRIADEGKDIEGGLSQYLRNRDGKYGREC